MDVTPKDMLGTALSVAGFMVLGWLVLVGLLAFQERRLIFFPTRTLAAAPADFGLRAEELSITAADGVTLHGWWIEGPGDRVLIWYHGNAGNIGDRLHNARWFVDRLGVDVVLVDYRGYGRSEGSPDEEGLYLDGLAIYDAVATRPVPEANIVLFGRSLGGAVAIETALRRPAGVLVLESVFRSVPALAREHYWFVPSAVVRTQMDNLSKMARVRTPTLVLHGDRDGIVPLSHGRRLFEAAGGAARLHVIEGAGHNDTYLVGGEPYAQAWEAFLRGYSGGAPATTRGRRGRETRHEETGSDPGGRPARHHGGGRVRDLRVRPAIGDRGSPEQLRRR